MKRAVIYVVILGVVCTMLGVAGGMLLERRYISRCLFPKVAGLHSLAYPAKRDFLGKREKAESHKRMWARAEGQFNKLCQELELSPEQADKVKTILEEGKVQVMRTKDEFKTKLQQVRTETDARISELLNPEQKEKFESLKTKAKKICRIGEERWEKRQK